MGYLYQKSEELCKKSDTLVVCEPPLTKHLSRDELLEIEYKPLITVLKCHTQGDERLVKLTTESVGRIKNHDRQIGLAFNTIPAREKCK